MKSLYEGGNGNVRTIDERKNRRRRSGTVDQFDDYGNGRALYNRRGKSGIRDKPGSIYCKS